MHALFGKINLLYHRGKVGEGNGKLVQYFLPGVWQATDYGVAESDTTEHAHT